MHVMLLESAPGAGSAVGATLEAAGSTVSRCHQPGLAPFPCSGLSDPTACPLARHVDVAVLVRADGEPAPTPYEHGVTCALQAGVPLVEQAPGQPSPFGPWVAAACDGDVVAACHQAVSAHHARLATVVSEAIAPTLARAGIAASDVQCRFEELPTGLRLDISGPLPAGVAGMIAVRATTALPRARRGGDQLDVTVTSPVP
jgi:hypothetical protein